MSKNIRRAVASFCCALASGVIYMTLPLAFPNAPVFIWRILLGAAAGLLCVCGLIIYYDFAIIPARKRGLVGPLVLVSFGTILLLLGTIWAFSRVQPPEPEPLKTAVPTKVSQLVADKTPVLLRLNFLGGLQQPIQLRNENIVYWYSRWSSVQIMPVAANNKPMSIEEMPGGWTIVLFYDHPSEINQLVLESAAVRNMSYDVKKLSNVGAIIEIRQDVPPGILDIYSIN